MSDDEDVLVEVSEGSIVKNPEGLSMRRLGTSEDPLADENDLVNAKREWAELCRKQ